MIDFRSLIWTLLLVICIYYRQQILHWCYIARHTFTRDAWWVLVSPWPFLIVIPQRSWLMSYTCVRWSAWLTLSVTVFFFQEHSALLGVTDFSLSIVSSPSFLITWCSCFFCLSFFFPRPTLYLLLSNFCECPSSQSMMPFNGSPTLFHPFSTRVLLSFSCQLSTVLLSLSLSCFFWCIEVCKGINNQVGILLFWSGPLTFSRLSSSVTFSPWCRHESNIQPLLSIEICRNMSINHPRVAQITDAWVRTNTCNTHTRPHHRLSACVCDFARQCVCLWYEEERKRVVRVIANGYSSNCCDAREGKEWGENDIRLSHRHSKKNLLSSSSLSPPRMCNDVRLGKLMWYSTGTESFFLLSLPCC